jgi:hypothetical protein
LANLQEPLFFLESFAGQAQATRSVQSSFPGKVTAAIDVKFSEKLDINTNSGMGTFAWFKAHIFPITKMWHFILNFG